MKRADVIWIAAGAVVGVLVLGGALLALDGGLASIGLLLPLAVLVGGLLWASEAARPGTTPRAARTGRVASGMTDQSVPPVVIGDPGAVDAPTVIPVPEPTADDSTTEAVRLEAARAFDLETYLVDEDPDRIQCHQCGRYDRLTIDRDHRIACRACGTGRSLTDVQPDTRVRLFDTGPDTDTDPGMDPDNLASDPETEQPAEPGVAPSRFAPPTASRGG